VFPVSLDVRLSPLVFLGLTNRESEMHRSPKKGTYRLFRLNGVDVYLGTRIGELGIEVKHVVIVHVLAHWALLQHFLVRARKALQRPFQVALLCRA